MTGTLLYLSYSCLDFLFACYRYLCLSIAEFSPRGCWPSCCVFFFSIFDFSVLYWSCLFSRLQLLEFVYLPVYWYLLMSSMSSLPTLFFYFRNQQHYFGCSDIFFHFIVYLLLRHILRQFFYNYSCGVAFFHCLVVVGSFSIAACW